MGLNPLTMQSMSYGGGNPGNVPGGALPYHANTPLDMNMNMNQAYQGAYQGYNLPR